jgi:outer membrane protein assembly factor BamB
MKKNLVLGILIASILMVSPFSYSDTLAQAPEPAAWPMLAANPQRTSWSPEEVRGNLNVEWYRPIEPYIPYKVQPIAANGKLYISTARGLYTFNASNGDLLWVYPTELPLGHSPTIAAINGRSIAFVGGYDRKIHAVDANSGQEISGYIPFEAAAGFETNPLVVNNTIYAGNRDGYFYALEAVTGGLKWRYKTDGPILFSAAYKNGVLYFASNDAHAYALNANDGSLVWKSQKLPGSGFHSYWPVIYTQKGTGKDYVIFTSGENYLLSVLSLTGEETNTLFGSIPVGGLIGPTSTAIPGDWVPGTVVMNASRITNYYQSKPYRRTVLVLDGATGQEFTFDSNGDGQPEYAPFTWSGVTQSGNKYPPVINGVDGVYYQGTAYYSAGWVSRGGPVGWKFGTQYISRVHTGNGPGATIGHASDEPMAYSSGGKLIYWSLCCDREAGAYDVTIPSGQPNRDWYYWGYSLAGNSLAPGYQQMYNAGDPTAYNNGDGWQIYSGKDRSKNGVYGKHGTTQSPPIPYQGKVYLLKGNALLAFSPNGTNPNTPLPLATIVPVQSAVTPPSKAELTQRLEAEVQKMLAAGPIRPGYYAAGFVDIYGTGRYTDAREFGELFDYFQNPADTVYTLLSAYPHLSSTTQQQVKTYLQNNYGPGAKYDFTKIVHVGWGTGAPREVFDIPPEVSSQWGQPYTSPYNPSTEPICGWCGYWQHFPPFSFYAAWKYAQIVGDNDPAFAKNIFGRMRDKLEDPLSDSTLIKKPYWLNLYIAGYNGYLELQKLAGYPQDPNVLATYQHLLDLRVNSFSKDSPYPPIGSSGGGTAGETYNNTLAVARNFMFLTPELANYLNQHIYSQIQDAMNEYEYVAPYWFVAKFDASYGEGTFQHLYDYPALFQAKAYILNQPYEELVKWLDVPAFYRGDLFYIQNLVAALGLGPAEPDFLLRLEPPFRSITTGGTAEYSVQIERLNNFTDTVTIQLGDSPSPDLDISPPAPSTFILSGDQTSLTVADDHNPLFTDAVWYTLPITASGGGLIRTGAVQTLINGKQVFLPAITKGN